MPDPMKVEVISSRFETGMKVFGGLGSVAAAAQSAFAIYGLFQAGKSDTDKIVDALKEMTTRLEAALAKVAENVKDGSVIAQWDKNRVATLEWKTRVITRGDELASINLTRKTVEVNGEEIGLKEWCEGPSGVLTELASILQKIKAWLEASDPGALNPVAQWDQTIRGGTAQRLLDGADENVITLMGQWFEAVAGLVQTATYIRNAAFALYQHSDNAKTSFRNSNRTLDLLGRVSDSTVDGKPKAGKGAWKAFEKPFESYLEVKMLDDDAHIMSRDSWQRPGGTSVISDDHSFMVGGFGANAGANSYIAGLNFGHSGGAWGIQATIVTILGDGTMKVRRSVPPQEIGAITNDQGRPLFTTYDMRKLDNVGGMYLAVGEIPEFASAVPINWGSGSHNYIYVVSGFSVKKLGDVWAICLQMAEMYFRADGKVYIMNRMNWETPGFGPSRIPEYFRIANDIDKLHRGVSGTASLAPITNASFMRVNTYEVSLRTRCNWPYRPDVFQPAFLTQFSPANPPDAPPPPDRAIGRVQPPATPLPVASAPTPPIPLPA